MRFFMARFFMTAALAVQVAAPALAQTLALKPSAFQHAAAAPAVSASEVAPGGVVTLWADVTPLEDVHIYAPGAKDFTPVSLVLTPHAGLTPGKTVYPASELQSTVGVLELVPVYRKTFRIAQPITIGRQAKSGDTLKIAGVVNYQACDENLCYPTDSIPLAWTVLIK